MRERGRERYYRRKFQTTISSHIFFCAKRVARNQYLCLLECDEQSALIAFLPVHTLRMGSAGAARRSHCSVAVLYVSCK
jgi:hypothetical protein